MVTAASTRKGHATLLTLWIDEDLILEYGTMADGWGWLLKPCVEPSPNMDSLLDHQQLELRVQRLAVYAVRVEQRM